MAKVKPGVWAVPRGSSGDQPSALPFLLVAQAASYLRVGGRVKAGCGTFLVDGWIRGVRKGWEFRAHVGWGWAPEGGGGHSPALALEGRQKARRSRRDRIVPRRLHRSEWLGLPLLALRCPLAPRRGKGYRWAH